MVRSISTLGRDHRRKRQRLKNNAWIGAAVAAALVLFAVSGYQAGISRDHATVASAKEELSAWREERQRLMEDVAWAEAREARLQQRLEELEQAYAFDVPRGESASLLKIVEQHLDDGVAPERLRFVLQGFAETPRCGATTQTRDVAVRTPLTTTVNNSASFAAGRIVVSAEGYEGPVTDQEAIAGFDRSRPVTLHFLMIDGNVSNIRGLLPLSHAVAIDGAEFRFTATSADQGGDIVLTAQECRGLEATAG